MDPPTSIPTSAAATATATASASVQHVTKRSSDELLRKFADSCNEAEASARKKAIRELSKQRKKSRKSGEFDQSESPSNGKSSSLVERRSLLPVVAGTKNKGLLLRQLGGSWQVKGYQEQVPFWYHSQDLEEDHRRGFKGFHGEALQ